MSGDGEISAHMWVHTNSACSAGVPNLTLTEGVLMFCSLNYLLSEDHLLLVFLNFLSTSVLSCVIDFRERSEFAEPRFSLSTRSTRSMGESGVLHPVRYLTLTHRAARKPMLKEEGGTQTRLQQRSG